MTDLSRIRRNRLYRLIRNASRVVLKPLAYAYMACEYFVLLIPHIKTLREMEFIYPLWFWSFGHQAIDLHMLAMRFRGRNVLALISDYRNFNPYIVDSFRPYVHLRFLPHTALMKNLRPWLRMDVMKVRRMKFAVLRFMLRLIGSKAHVVAEISERQGSQLEGVFITERLELFSKHADMKIAPPQEAIDRFRRILEETHPELKGKWFVSLYLRKKVSGRKDIRDTEPEPYSVVIDRIREIGGFVFCGGDYDPHEVFPGKEGVFGYGDFPCDRRLTDIFFITQCRFIVGPASGPVAVAISFNIPALMTNDALFYHSAARKNQIVLYKKAREVTTGRILTARETFSLPIVGYRSTEEFDRAGLELIDNTREDIGEALEEMVQRHIVGNEIVKPEHQPLYERFRSLLPKESIIYQTPARPALTYLQNLLW